MMFIFLEIIHAIILKDSEDLEYKEIKLRNYIEYKDGFDCTRL